MSHLLSRVVPEHDVVEFAPRRHSFCVAVFAINEGGRIRRQLAKMAEYADVVDIVVADGGSTDGSMEHSYLEQAGVRALLTKRGDGKLGSQMRMAFSWALEQGYAGVISMDGNDKDDPEALPRFVASLESGVDHVQGSRFIAGGHHENTPRSRLLGVRLLHAPLISLAARRRYSDTTNGFRGYSRRLLEDERIALFREEFTGYELHYYLAIRSARLGMRIEEIPVSRIYPAHGKVPTKISPIAGNLGLMRTLARAVRHRYDPPKPARGSTRRTA
jgi:glycosyltransferase involved in cell wall biosynthesis